MLCRSTSKVPLRAFAGVRSVVEINVATSVRSTRPPSAPAVRAFLTSASFVDGRTDQGGKENIPSAVLHRSLKDAPLQVVSGDGKYLTFSNGHKIMDTTCGAAVACIGYGNKRVQKAMTEQMDKFAYCNSMFFGHPVGEALAAELVNGTNGVMSKAYIMCSG